MKCPHLKEGGACAFTPNRSCSPVTCPVLAISEDVLRAQILFRAAACEELIAFKERHASILESKHKEMINEIVLDISDKGNELYEQLEESNYEQNQMESDDQASRTGDEGHPQS